MHTLLSHPAADIDIMRMCAHACLVDRDVSDDLSEIYMPSGLGMLAQVRASEHVGNAEETQNNQSTKGEHAPMLTAAKAPPLQFLA